MTHFRSSIILALIAFLVTQISVAAELVEDKKRAAVNSIASAATNDSEKK